MARFFAINGMNPRASPGSKILRLRRRVLTQQGTHTAPTSVGDKDLFQVWKKSSLMPPFNLKFFADKLHRMQSTVFFVQIGAMDGKTHDPIYDLVRSYGWRGILVEPMKDHFEKLKRNYAGCEGLIFENLAISEHAGTNIMYRIPTQTVHDKKLPEWGLQASSFFPDRNALGWDDIKPHVIQETVTCLRLPDLLEKHHVQDVHVLQLDAEGYDYRILRQLDFTRFKPYVINLEIVNMTRSELGHCKQFLDKHQYLYSKTGYDLLAISLPLMGL